jgi:hypothetical protein
LRRPTDGGGELYLARPVKSRHAATMSGEQLDLFAATGVTQPWAGRAHLAREPVEPGELSDAALIEAIPLADPASCEALAAEAVRRRPSGAVSALEALCRRFKGFGLCHSIAEQIAALRALAAIGGRDAADALRRLIDCAAVQGPGLAEAVSAAAVLCCRLSEAAALAVLRHGDPAVRADACRCAPITTETMAVLQALLDDLHPDVAIAAARVLGHAGRAEVRGVLLRALRESPDPDLIEAILPIADEEAVVVLGRVAERHPALRAAVLTELDDIDLPRAAVVRARLER